MDLEDWFTAQHRFAAFVGCRFVIRAGCLVFEAAE
jgi:hypothetical protein